MRADFVSINSSISVLSLRYVILIMTVEKKSYGLNTLYSNLTIFIYSIITAIVH